ncbi:hypothetical protein Trydic_g8907 [Trypoxylus dichotomus]
MDDLKYYLEKLKDDEVVNNKLDEIYSILANISISTDNEEEFKDEVVPQLHMLFESGKIKKEILYISLLQ